MNIIKGQTVRLNARGIKVHMSCGGAQVRGHPVNWNTRIGTVISVGRYGQTRVLWQGNKAPSDALSVVCFEAVE